MGYLATTTMPYLTSIDASLMLKLKNIERCIEDREFSNGLDIVRNLIRGSSLMTQSSITIPTVTPIKRDKIEFGALCIEKKSAKVTLNTQLVELSANEFSLLMLLVENHDEIVSRDTLHETILKTEYDGLNRSIDNTVSRIRKKLGDDCLSQLKIKSIRGKGYLFSSRDW